VENIVWAISKQCPHFVQGACIDDW